MNKWLYGLLCELQETVEDGQTVLEAEKVKVIIQTSGWSWIDWDTHVGRCLMWLIYQKPDSALKREIVSINKECIGSCELKDGQEFWFRLNNKNGFKCKLIDGKPYYKQGSSFHHVNQLDVYIKPQLKGKDVPDRVPYKHGSNMRIRIDGTVYVIKEKYRNELSYCALEVELL